MMQSILLVGIGGFLGAISRYGLAYLSRVHFGMTFPFATLIVNVFGCFAVGLVLGYFREHHLFPVLSLFFVSGFIGSFTTFSAVGYETFDLLKSGKTKLAALNIGGNTILGILAVACGISFKSFFR